MPHRKYIVCLSLSRFHKFFFLRSLPSIQQNFFFSEYKEPTTAQHRNALMLFWNWIKKKLRGLRESHEKVTHTITQVLSHRKKSPLRIANGFQRRQWRFVVKRIFVLCLSVIPGSLCNAMRKRENCSCVWVFVCIIVTGKISFRVLSKAPSSQQSFEKYTDFPPPHFFFFVVYFTSLDSLVVCFVNSLGYTYIFTQYIVCVSCVCTLDFSIGSSTSRAHSCLCCCDIALVRLILYFLNHRISMLWSISCDIFTSTTRFFLEK